LKEDASELLDEVVRGVDVPFDQKVVIGVLNPLVTLGGVHSHHAHWGWKGRSFNGHGES